MGYTSYPPASGGGAVSTYANLAAFPVSATNGTLAIALDTDTLYIYDSTTSAWLPIGGPSVPFNIGTLDGAAKNANGATLGSNSIYMQTATSVFPGLISSTSQTFSGQKAFTQPLSIGSGFSNALLTVSSNTTIIAPPTNTNVHIVGADNALNRVTLDSFNTVVGGGPGFIGRRARGTAASPTSVQTDDTLMFIGASAYGTSGFSSVTQSAVSFKASQTWTNSNNGTYIQFNVSANSTSGSITRFRIDQDGQLYASAYAGAAGNLTIGSGGAIVSGSTSVSNLVGSVSLTNQVRGVLPVVNGGTGSSGYTAGSVIFAGAQALSENNSMLFWDNTTTKLGVGTPAPTHAITLSDVESLGSGSTVNGGIALYGTADQVTNYERLVLSFNQSVFTISPNNGGSGAFRSLRVGVPNGTNQLVPNRYLQFNTNTPFFTWVASTGTPGNFIDFSSTISIVSSSGSANFMSINPLIQQTGSAAYDCLLINPSESTTGAGRRNLINANVSGAQRFVVNAQGQVGIGSTYPTQALQISSGSAQLDSGRIVAPIHVIGSISVSQSAGGAAYTLQMPLAQGGASTVLQNNGAGSLSWAAALTNPMTSPGDIIVGSGGGSAIRLGVGNNNMVLKASSVSSTSVKWDYPDGDVTSVTSNTTLNANTGLLIVGSGTSTITLPSAVGLTGQRFKFVYNLGTADPVTIYTSSSQTMNLGSSTLTTINTRGEVLELNVVSSQGFVISNRKAQTDFITYTPTYSAFGTATASYVISKRVGDSLHVQGRFTAGTVTAAEPRVSLAVYGFNLTVDPVKTPVVKECGNWSASFAGGQGPILINGGTTYLNFGAVSGTQAGLTVLSDATTTFPNNATVIFDAMIPILGWNS